jgi:uncharacterized protein YecE (DUF72 family)
MIIGTAGWAIPAPYGAVFPAKGSQLARYAALLGGVEINSSFYRPHRRMTYERWAASVPAGFRFSAKLPRAITHERRLVGCEALLDKFLAEVTGLGEKLGFLLVQLPPSLAFERQGAEAFFQALSRCGIRIACEPRHASWFTARAEENLQKRRVVRVAADPPRAPSDGAPGGDTSLAYFRLHGSHRIYYSGYSQAALATLAARLRAQDWCMFDNTAHFHALGNALTLTGLAARSPEDAVRT